MKLLRGFFVLCAVSILSSPPVSAQAARTLSSEPPRMNDAGAVVMTSQIIDRYLFASRSRAATGGAYWRSGNLSQREFALVEERVIAFLNGATSLFSSEELAVLSQRRSDLQAAQNGKWELVNFPDTRDTRDTLPDTPSRVRVLYWNGGTPLVVNRYAKEVQRREVNWTDNHNWLESGYQISVPGNTWISVETPAGHVIEIGPNTIFDVEDLSQRPRFKVENGSVKVKTKPLPSINEVIKGIEVWTGTSQTVSEHTEFTVSYDARTRVGTTVVREGTVRVRNLATGAEVSVSQGQSVDVTERQLGQVRTGNVSNQPAPSAGKSGLGGLLGRIRDQVVAAGVLKAAGSGTSSGLLGAWYTDGNPNAIDYIREESGGIVFVNEFGGRAKGRIISNSLVIADEWEGGLRGNVSADGKRIAWANGTAWQRVDVPAQVLPSPSSGLLGAWYTDGNQNAVDYIREEGGSIVFVNQFGGRAKGRIVSNALVIADGWEGGLRGTVSPDGKRISWANGTSWQRINGATTLPVASSGMLGSWYTDGNRSAVDYIRDEAGGIVFINQFGGRARGRIISSSLVIADEWEGGLRGTVSPDGKRISWANGTSWQRMEDYAGPIDDIVLPRPNVPPGTAGFLGAWYTDGNQGAVDYIREEAGGVVFINQFGGRARGRIVSSSLVIADDWEGGLRGTVSPDGKRIAWANGTSWQRADAVAAAPLAASSGMLGSWYTDGNQNAIDYIREEAGGVVFINHFGGRARGRIISSSLVIADEWEGGLRGTVSPDGRRISWANGTFWTR